MRFALKNPKTQVFMRLPFLTPWCGLLACLFMVAFTGCSHTPPPPPSSSVDISGSEISEESLRALILRLNKRYENVDGRIVQNRQKIEALEKELISLQQSVAVLSPAERPSTVKAANNRLSGKSSPETPSPPDAKKLYDRALTAYYQRDYRTAISGFREFINTFPSSDLADNSFYWIGESYYGQEDFERAISSFLKLVDRYPHGNKVPDALFKIGLAYGELKNPEKATEFLTRLMDNYPFSAAAQKAKAKINQLD
jgi:tol-pal system protein YbgF